MPVLERTTRELNGEVIVDKTRPLFTLAELKEGKHLEGRDVVPSNESSGYERALERIAQMKGETGWTSDRLADEVSEYIVPEILGKAGIKTDPKTIEWDVSPVQGGMFFTLDPRNTSVDVPVFLRAMQAFYAGRDWRGPEYAASEQKPRLPVGKAIKHIDLRSADAWHARHGGLHVQTVSRWSGEIEPEAYDYEHEFSEEWRTDCNDFLSEVLGFALRTLMDAYESEEGEEQLLYDAEANEWLFTATGAFA